MAKAKRKAKRAHKCNGLLCFHGAFGSAEKADAKRRKLGKRAFVVRKFARFGGGSMTTRHIVMTRDSAAEFNF